MILNDFPPLTPPKEGNSLDFKLGISPPLLEGLGELQ